MTDPIADMLTRLRNAVMARHPRVRVPCSTLKQNMAQILRDEGFIQGFEVVEEGPRAWLDIELRYLDANRPALGGSKRVSRPGLRIYSRAREIPRIMGGIGVALISTSQGVMTGREAHQRRLGGEVLCFVW
jgi:small subunit ribosomal protein S8